MNHMDDGIFENREAVILHEAQIADAQKEIKVLKDATLNNMTNNVFLINFDSVNSVAITSGIYDPVARKLYVSRSSATRWCSSSSTRSCKTCSGPCSSMARLLASTGGARSAPPSKCSTT